MAPRADGPDDAAALLLGRYEKRQQFAGAPLDVLVRARTFEPARCFGSFGDCMCANALQVHDLKEPLDAGAQLFAAQLTANLRCQASERHQRCGIGVAEVEGLNPTADFKLEGDAHARCPLSKNE